MKEELTLRGINWGATLHVALCRLVVAGLLWAVILPLFSSGQGWRLENLLTAPLMMAGLSLFGLLCIGLHRLRVPYAEIGALATFPVVIADPILWILRKTGVFSLPVEKFGLVNNPIMIVYGH